MDVKECKFVQKEFKKSANGGALEEKKNRQETREGGLSFSVRGSCGP